MANFSHLTLPCATILSLWRRHAYAIRIVKEWDHSNRIHLDFLGLTTRIFIAYFSRSKKWFWSDIHSTGLLSSTLSYYYEAFNHYYHGNHVADSRKMLKFWFQQQNFLPWMKRLRRSRLQRIYHQHCMLHLVFDDNSSFLNVKTVSYHL